MKALLVCAAPVTGSSALVAELAANADLVIAVDGGADLCEDAGITPDVLLGDLDSVTPGAVDSLLARNIPIHQFPAEKDATDFELALAEARRHGASEVVVTAATAGRLDHTLAVLAALAATADMPSAIREPDLSGWLLSGRGRRSVLVKGTGSLVSLVPWGGVSLVSASGVRWPLTRAELGPETTVGISNIIQSADGARIELHQGVLFVLSVRGAREPASECR